MFDPCQGQAEMLYLQEPINLYKTIHYKDSQSIYYTCTLCNLDYYQPVDVPLTVERWQQGAIRCKFGQGIRT